VRVEHFQNIPNHTHPIEDSDLIKMTKIIQQIELAQKNNLSMLAQNLTQKDVANIQQKEQKLQNVNYFGNNTLENELQCAFDFLSTKTYQVRYFQAEDICNTCQGQNKVIKQQKKIQNQDEKPDSESIIELGNFDEHLMQIFDSYKCRNNNQENNNSSKFEFFCTVNISTLEENSKEQADYIIDIISKIDDYM
ncbi:3185_t:CDS:2, partial [Cetraspora pellucida]